MSGDDDFLDDLLADVGPDLSSCVQLPGAEEPLPPPPPPSPPSPPPFPEVTPAPRVMVAALIIPRLSATGFARVSNATEGSLFRVSELWRQVGAKAKIHSLDTGPDAVALSTEQLSLSPRATSRSKMQRFAIQGTGRISFAVEREELPLAFITHSKTHSASHAVEHKEQHPPRQRGIEAAKQMMAEWGEAWGEDEDLPSDATSSSSSQRESGAPGPLSKELQREAYLAQTRIHKLQSSKKNSKY